MSPLYIILGGLHQEFRSVSSALGMDRRLTRRGVAFMAGRCFGLDCIGAVSGIGHERAAAAARIAISEFSPAALISVGFSGGLREEVAVGDLVLAESVRLLRLDPPAPPIACDRVLLDAAREAAARSGHRSFIGPIVTEEAVLLTSQEKRTAGAATSALAVDMETWGAARASADHGVPYLSVRAISDPVSSDFGFDPDDWIASDGSLRIVRGIASLCRRPGTAVALARMAGAAHRASESLSAWARHLLRVLAEREGGVAVRP